MKGRSIPDSLGRHKPQAPGMFYQIRADAKWDVASPLHVNFLDIKARAMGLCDDWWRAAICLVPGLPIIMCQLNLTTVHYSGLRTPSAFTLLPMMPIPSPFLRRCSRRGRIGNNHHSDRNPITF